MLEDFKRCSESHLWKLMMSFYDRKGPESWSQGIVPHFITCNAFIGRAYAKVLHGFLCDSMHGGPTKIDPAEPLYIIELGAGSGKFGFFMLQALMELKATSPFPLEKALNISCLAWRKAPSRLRLADCSLKPILECTCCRRSPSSRPS